MTARTEQLASPRILAGVPGDISVTVYADGAAATVVASSVAVVDEAGTAVASGTGTAAGGVLTLALTAAENSRPRVLRATWTFTISAVSHTLETVHEAVGELLFSEAEARAYDNAALASAVTYPAATLLRARDQVHDAFEDVIGVAIGTRGTREVVDGSGKPELMLEANQVTRLRAVSERASGGSTWTAYSADAVADVLVYPWGYLYRESLGSFASGRRNVALEYEHGLAPIPLDLRRAALRLTRNLLVVSNVSDRALAETNQLGTFRMAVAGMREGAWFGIPPVDSVLQFYRDRYNVPTVR